MSITPIELAGLVLLGLLLGGAYFGEMYLTVRRLPESSRPEVLLITGFLVRIAVTGFVFYLLVADGEWLRLPVTLVGFILARMILVRRVSSPEPSVDSTGQS